MWELKLQTYTFILKYINDFLYEISLHGTLFIFIRSNGSFVQNRQTNPGR